MCRKKIDEHSFLNSFSFFVKQPLEWAVKNKELDSDIERAVIQEDNNNKKKKKELNKQ